MNQYVAVLRIGEPRPGELLSSVAVALRACRDQLDAVSEAQFDAHARSVTVRFDRARATVADIVRSLEDHGLTITGVAQSRTDPTARAASA